MAAAEQTAWLGVPEGEILDTPGAQSNPSHEDASLRSGSPAAIATQASLWSEEPTRMVGHTFERLYRDDGVAITVCHLHRREGLGWRSPCR